MNFINQSASRALLTANRKLTLFTLMALPVLIGLGLWQLDRAAQKRELKADYLAQQAQPPSPLNSANFNSLSDYRRVLVQGQFDPSHIWLLDNKQRNGRVGYEVVMAFKLLEGGVILVNRGWLASPERRQSLPKIPNANGPLLLFGELVSVSHHPLLNDTSLKEDWPRVVLAMDIDAMSEQLEQPLLERYVRLDEASPGALFTDWSAINISADKHMGYAVQWFAMAIALLIWFVIANTSLLQAWRSPKK